MVWEHLFTLAWRLQSFIFCLNFKLPRKVFSEASKWWRRNQLAACPVQAADKQRKAAVDQGNDKCRPLHLLRRAREKPASNPTKSRPSADGCLRHQGRRLVLYRHHQRQAAGGAWRLRLAGAAEVLSILLVLRRRCYGLKVKSLLAGEIPSLRPSLSSVRNYWTRWWTTRTAGHS